MAALVASLGSLQLPARLGFLTSLEPWLVSLRCASKKSSGASKNRGGNSPGKRYGWKKLDGDFVHTGNILATQRLIRWHPGANVGMGRRKTLFALEDGVVRYTKEVYVPPPRSLEAARVVCRLPRGAVLYKTCINVVPEKQEGRFKLVDML
ncbi:39S ribosomal protein L27, mitochondrial isoform X1 [Callorhinchus milii]|uniref:Large ribosomal subunit protein bL27m n=1 Tax=Callorhinchus milii TaxID=7868 RepID=K4FSP8_CALMI|nr:39S ribosomal protein L27, mitochondrial [Callorhinchus milii]XP_007886968.1 39S ribosomal protein L27, mitochondrial isoform X1 [Callorhinchus milii]AFK10720.1 Mitochondrial 39S ribosomal protein L27 [Callorhinchus milii]|eukprot:gi/632943474/ref/XP_007886968.1/ PREDICTED: 39S ribosomal protein L27, mitochondrial [Callorhinchus milii]